MAKSKGGLLMGLGAALLLAAAVWAGQNLWADRRAADAAAPVLTVLEEEHPAADVPDWQAHPDMEMPETEVDGQSYIGVLRIPGIGVELPVISRLSRAALKVAPCRYAGSVYAGNMVIAAHNYRAHFGKLRQLAAGDEVVFTDVDGNVFCYRVAGVEVLPATAVAEMTGGGWALTLFTCTPGGANRVTVRCERME